MAQGIGVGGVSLKARDLKVFSAWSAEQLGMGGSEEAFVVLEGPAARGTTVFARFPIFPCLQGNRVELRQLQHIGLANRPTCRTRKGFCRTNLHL